MRSTSPRAGLALALQAAVLPFLLARAAAAQGGAGPGDPGGRRVARALARAADADGDGSTGAREWKTFVDGLGEPGAPLARRVTARLLELDCDGDGELTTADVRLCLQEPDDGAERGTLPGFLPVLLGALADADGDGRVTDAERTALYEEASPPRGDAVPEEVVVEWLRRAEELPPPAGERDAFTPGLVVASWAALLDADGNGAVSLADLEAFRASLDGNGDGDLDAGELARAGGGGGNGGAGWEERWRVADEERERPPLVPWQRSLEDALSLCERTGKPLLICVNIDGEMASESLAWGRYRDPGFAALVAGFVPVLASPDTHEPREHDDRGRRLADPRFGRLVCSEHVALEPKVYERWFGGRRVAPRHVGVGPDGEVLFDLFLLQDLSAIDRALREHGVAGTAAPAPSERSTEELLASPDAADRGELEARFVAAPPAERLRLAGLALVEGRPVRQPELLRLALRDPEETVRRAGVEAMAAHPLLAPLELVPAAFARAHERVLEERLVAGLALAVDAAEESGDTERRDLAAFHHRVHAGLLAGSEALDLPGWRRALAGLPPDRAEPGPDLDETSARLDAAEHALDRRGDDGELWAEVAGLRVRMAELALESGGNPSFFALDAVDAAGRALALGEDGRALGHRARARWILGRSEEAAADAAAALPLLLAHPSSPAVLEAARVLASTRTSAVYAGLQGPGSWPEAALPDACAAGELLLAHPAGSEEDAKGYLELLGAVRAEGRQGAVARRAVARFPGSGEMHAWLRFQVLRDEGARALERVYEEEPLASCGGDPGTLAWFHALATFEAAEQDVRNRDERAALGAYARCVARFDRCLELRPEFAGSATHYQCLASSGAAHLFAVGGQLAEAVELLLGGLERAPTSWREPDGLGRSPAEVATELRAALGGGGGRDAERAALLERLERGLDALDLGR